MDLKNVIILFIIAIVGITLLGVIADKSYENTNLLLTNVTDQNNTWTTLVDGASGIDTTSANSRWTITGLTLYHSWESLRLTNDSILTKDTDYNVTYSNPADTVIIQLASTVNTISIGGVDNVTKAAYYDYPEEYVQGSSAARTLLDLNKLWFVLGIFMLVVAIVWMQLKKNDLI